MASLTLTILILSVAATGAIDAPSCASVDPGEIDTSGLGYTLGYTVNWPPDHSVNPGGLVSVDPGPNRVPGDQVDGLARQWSIVYPDGTVDQLFSANPVTSDTKLYEFFAQGGIVYNKWPIADGTSMVKLVGPTSTKVDVGRHTAVLGWSGPLPSGVSVHSVTWADDAFNYSLVGNRSPEVLVTTARNLVCEGS